MHNDEMNGWLQNLVGMTMLGSIALVLPVFFLFHRSAHAVDPDATAAVTPFEFLAKNYGCYNGTHAYATEGGVCNIGDEPLLGDFSAGEDDATQHPMWTQNLYRLSNNRFEQIGQSWVKHDAWDTDQIPCCGTASCVPCPNPEQPLCLDNPGPTLGPGCSDVYDACTNGDQDQSLGPRYQINALTGAWPVNTPTQWCSPSGDDTALDCRLQVKTADLVTGTGYFLEQQVITPDEWPDGNRTNNVSYQTASLGSATACSGSDCNVSRLCGGTGCSNIYSLASGSDPACQVPAIYGWKDSETTCTGTENCVKETVIQVSGEGRFILAAKAMPSTPTGFWSYEYALYNMNSERGAVSFVIPLMEDTCAVVSTNSFHDVDYHDGDGVGCGGGCTCSGGTNNGQSCDDPAQCPGGVCTGGTRLNFDGTPWAATVTEGSVSWATTPYSQKQNANALRWGTLYNFRFRADRAPTVGNATIGLFKSGGTQQAETLIPWGESGQISCDY